MKSRTMRTRSGVVSLGGDGILRFRAIPGVEHDEEGALDNLSELRQLASGKLRPVLIDLREVGVVAREARQAYANLADFAAAQGLLVGSAFTRIVGSVFLRVNRPQQPARMFTVEEEAVQWLKGFLK